MNLGKNLKRLPNPVGVYSAPDAIFEVYRAKNLGLPQWNHPALRGIVAVCRESYLRYGKRPLFDAYDAKAAVYLTRVIYKKGAERAEEWLTLRMVPGEKAPIGVSEPEIFVRLGKGLDYWMKRKIKKQNIWKHVVSSSRMCGINPYTISNSGVVHFLEDAHHSHTPICFALMHKQFILDYPLERFPYLYITGMIRNDFYKKGLSYISGKRAFRPLFTPAYKFLGWKKNEIAVQRDAYSYQFPLYWFDIKKLLVLINKLREKEHKTPLARLEPKMFFGLANKVRHPISIAGVHIEPAALRILIDRYVPDAPELKITEAGPLYRSMEKLLRAARVKTIKESTI